MLWVCDRGSLARARARSLSLSLFLSLSLSCMCEEERRACLHITTLVHGASEEGYPHEDSV